MRQSKKEEKKREKEPQDKASANGPLKNLFLILNFVLVPIKQLGEKSFYSLMLLDFLLLIGFIVIGMVLNWLVLAYQDNIALNLIMFIILIPILLLLYATVKYFFYRVIEKRTGRKMHFWEILWKHLVVMIIITIVNYAVLYVLVLLIILTVLPDHAEFLKKASLVLLAVLAYLIFLIFQREYLLDPDKIFRLVSTSYRRFFSSFTSLSPLAKILIYDIIMIIVFYFLFNIIAFVFRLLLYTNADLALLNKLFTPIASLLIIVMLASIMTINKIVIFEYNI